jgi:hypothetical protein
MTWLRFVLFIVNSVSAYAFSYNFGRMLFGDPAFIPSISNRRGISLQLAMGKDVRQGLNPSWEDDCASFFKAVIKNRDYAWSVINDDIDINFPAPHKDAVFHVEYGEKLENYIADQIVQRRIIPIIQSANVKPSDYFEICSYSVN